MFSPHPGSALFRPEPVVDAGAVEDVGAEGDAGQWGAGAVWLEADGALAGGGPLVGFEDGEGVAVGGCHYGGLALVWGLLLGLRVGGGESICAINVLAFVTSTMGGKDKCARIGLSRMQVDTTCSIVTDDKGRCLHSCGQSPVFCRSDNGVVLQNN